MTSQTLLSTRQNPLSSSYDGDPTDRALVQSAVEGDRTALEQLIRRHQTFIHSLAQRVLYAPEDAADATQDVLMRIITHLGSYRGEAAFRTWAYRIAVRQLLTFRKARVEHTVHDFECFQGYLEQTPNLDLLPQGALPADLQLAVEEAKVGCLMAMLICLKREQRLAFALCEIFEATDTVCAEVMEISADTARQYVSRARQQLRAFLTGRCGLIDPSGSCHCAQKTRGFINQGIVDPARLRFTPMHLERTAETAALRSRELGRMVDETYAQLLRAQPTAPAPDFVILLRELVSQPEFRRTLNIDH